MRSVTALIAFIFLIVVTSAMILNTDPRFRFETEIHCNDGHGKWCAAAYIFELDSSSPDDPLLYMRFCTKNRSKTIIVDMDPLGGDGALNGFFQSEYEFGIQIFHTCSPSARSCTSMTWQPVKYVGRPILFVQHFFDFPFDVSHDADSGRCSVPEAFQDLEGWFGQPPPTDPFTFYQQDFKRTYVWTYQKGVL